MLEHSPALVFVEETPSGVDTRSKVFTVPETTILH